MRKTRDNFVFHCKCLSLAISSLPEPKMRNGPQVRLQNTEMDSILTVQSAYVLRMGHGQVQDVWRSSEMASGTQCAAMVLTNRTHPLFAGSLATHCESSFCITLLKELACLKPFGPGDRSN